MEFHSWRDSAGGQHLYSRGGCAEAEWQHRTAGKPVTEQHSCGVQLDNRLVLGQQGSNAHCTGAIQGKELNQRHEKWHSYWTLACAGLGESCCCAQVAPITDVAFNNLVCAQLPLQPLGGSPAAAPSAMPEQNAEPGNNTLTEPSPLYVEYAPVVYLQNQQQSSSSWQSDINSLITFLVRCDTSLYLLSQLHHCSDWCLSNVQTRQDEGDDDACRVANLGQEGSIDAGRVNLQYWFNGPSDIPDAADPLSQFAMSCLDTTTSVTSFASLACMLLDCMSSLVSRHGLNQYWYVRHRLRRLDIQYHQWAATCEWSALCPKCWFQTGHCFAAE